MELIVIHQDTEFVNGGCNACPTIKAARWTITLNGVTQSLEQLDMNSLLMAVLLSKGYKQQQEYDVTEDYDIYKKGDHSVAVYERYPNLMLQKGHDSKTVKNNYTHVEDLFEEATVLLDSYFDLPDLLFSLNIVS